MAFCLPGAMHAWPDLIFSSAPAYATPVRQQARTGGIQGEAAVIARSPARLSSSDSEALHLLSSCGARRECDSISIRASSGYDRPLLGRPVIARSASDVRKAAVAAFRPESA